MNNYELIVALGSIACIGALLYHISQRFPYKKLIEFFQNAKIWIFQKRNNFELIGDIPYAIKRRELSDLRKAFRDKNTKVIVITGDVKTGKTFLVEMFLSELRNKRIHLGRYSVVRCDLNHITLKEDLLNKFSFDLEGKSMITQQTSITSGFYGPSGIQGTTGFHGPHEMQETLINELNARNCILFLDNLDPFLHDEILDLIISVMKFLSKAKVIIVTPTFPEKFDKVDRLYGIVKEVNVDRYNLAEIKSILDKYSVKYLAKDAIEIKNLTNGNPYEIAKLISCLEENEIIKKGIEISTFDLKIVFDEPEVKSVRQEIVNQRYRRVYKNLDEETKIIPQILSALLNPCSLKELQMLYSSYLGKDMSSKFRKIKLKKHLEDNLRYNLINEENDKYFLENSTKDLIYKNFDRKNKEKLHKTSIKHFEEKKEELPTHEEEYNYQKTRIEILRTETKAHHDDTRIYDSKLE